MSFVERPLLFDCEGERLVGVISLPDAAAHTGVLVIVGGPQYRVGSHRQFVRLARALAAAGYPTLRFDYRGMGDSSGAARTFEDCRGDIAAAVGALRAARPDVERIVLWGLCDAAPAALDFWQETQNPAIAGMVLLNPWARSDTTLAKAHIKHYYGQRLMEREFWRKLLTGGVAHVEALRSFASNLRSSLNGAGRVSNDGAPVFQERMASALRSFPGAVLLILSGEDLTAKEFLEYAQASPSWQGVLQRPGIERHDLASADHTFSSPDAAREVEARTVAWLRAAVGRDPQ